MSVADPNALSASGLRDLARGRLRPRLDADDLVNHSSTGPSDYNLSGTPPDAVVLARSKPAAVLAPIVARPQGLSVLLTLRAADLRSHSGQVAFPGGKIDAGETPYDAALREAHEEIGLEARFIEPIGWLDPYLTGTGFRIAPLVALIDPAFTLAINQREVDEAFETPFAFLMNPANYRLEDRVWQGKARKFYAMPYEGRYIWGATAGILRNLHERLFS